MGIRDSKKSLGTSGEREPAWEEALALFPLEQLQNLDAESAVRCQCILGHGNKFGIWETPEFLVEAMTGCRRIDFRLRLLAFLPKNFHGSVGLDELLAEGVLYLTRLGLLMRIGPAQIRAGGSKAKPLDATTIATHLFSFCPQVIARGIERRLTGKANPTAGFAHALTLEDVEEFGALKKLRGELKRLRMLHSRGLWQDAPPQRKFLGATTAVRGSKSENSSPKQSVPFPPLPDAYMAEMGSRALWLIRDLGPNLIHLLRTLSAQIGQKKFSKTASIGARIACYFKENEWRDRQGEVIVGAPFVLKHISLRGQPRAKRILKKEDEWPPQNWSSIQNLAVTLQRAHLWLAMLVMAARQGEILTLKRDCVEEAEDGQVYVNGRTFKASLRFDGRAKESPPPDILVFALAQQVHLVEACENLVRITHRHDGFIKTEVPSAHLWASLGIGTAKHTQRLKQLGDVLISLAKSLDLDTKPGGKNIHPHRIRKSISRLAGITIDSSQKVLMRLLGHEDVTTTLLYMQSDPAFAKEIDDVTRELRILRAEGLIKDMHAALHEAGSLAYAGHGGGGAIVLSDSVRAYEATLHHEGREWGVSTARELAILLTNNGESARLVAQHVVCTKTAGEVGLCSQKKGAIVPGNCQVECKNHIEEASGRREVERIIPILVEHAEKNISEGNWLPAQHNKRQLIKELSRYDDINDSFRSMAKVQNILGWDE